MVPDVMVVVCYRPFSQGGEAHGIFYKQLGRVLLTGDFSFPDIN